MRLFKKIATAAITTVALASASLAADEPYKIYLSMSYIGNDWQAESSNAIRAMAASAGMKDKVSLEVQVAGPNAQKQIQQINAMVQAGADAIIIFPISPTALNPVVKAACDKGVLVFSYESDITEPCAHVVSIDNAEFGRATAQWLVDALGGKGNVVYISGVPGVSAETQRTDAIKAVFAANPGINVIAEGVGMWSESVARSEMTKIMASTTWDQVDGVLAQIGCYSVNELQIEAGIPIDKLKPCSGESGNGNLVQMLPIGTEVPGASGNYAPMGAKGFTTWAPVSSGAYALKLAVDALDGKEIPDDVVINARQLSSDQVTFCPTGSWEEMKNGCSALSPELVGNPGFFPSIYNENTPEIGLNAVLTGQPEN